jgi:hypothetical protein
MLRELDAPRGRAHPAPASRENIRQAQRSQCDALARHRATRRGRGSRSIAAGSRAYCTSVWIDAATCPIVVELRAIRIGLHVRRDIGAARPRVLLCLLVELAIESTSFLLSAASARSVSVTAMPALRMQRQNPRRRPSRLIAYSMPVPVFTNLHRASRCASPKYGSIKEH